MSRADRSAAIADARFRKSLVDQEINKQQQIQRATSRMDPKWYKVDADLKELKRQRADLNKVIKPPSAKKKRTKRGWSGVPFRFGR